MTTITDPDLKSLNVSKLTGKNAYSLWSYRMKMALEGMDLFEVVKGTHVKPADENSEEFKK